MNADKQYDRQFLAWAVDRALRFYEVNKQTCTQEEVIALAEKFCGWIMPAKDAEEPKIEGTPVEKEMVAEHDAHVSGEEPKIVN